MHRRTEAVTQRVTKLVKELIALEQKDHGGSKADALERLIMRGSTSAGARELMLNEARKDPRFGPLFQAVAETGNPQGRKKKRIPV